MEEDGIVEELGKASWAGAEGARHELTMNSGMTLRKIIGNHGASSNVLHVLHHGLNAEHKGFSAG